MGRRRAGVGCKILGDAAIDRGTLRKLGSSRAGRQSTAHWTPHLNFDGKLFGLKTLRGGRGKPNRAPEAIIDPRRRLHELRRVRGRVGKCARSGRYRFRGPLDVMRMAWTIRVRVAARIEWIFRRRGATALDTIPSGGGERNDSSLHAKRPAAQRWRDGSHRCRCRIPVLQFGYYSTFPTWSCVYWSSARCARRFWTFESMQSSE